MSPKTLKTTFYPCYSHRVLPNLLPSIWIKTSYFQNKQQGKLGHYMNTSIFKMYGAWQCYNFDAKVLNFQYVTILNVEESNILGFVREWPFDISGVTQLNSQTYNFDCNTVSPAHASSRLHQGISAVDQGILLHHRSGKTSSVQCRRASNM